MTKLKADASTQLRVAVEEICLELLKDKAVADTLIPRTRIVFELNDELKGEQKSTQISVAVDPIKILLGFRHIQFFAAASARIVSVLPELTQSSDSQSQVLLLCAHDTLYRQKQPHRRLQSRPDRNRPPRFVARWVFSRS